MNDVANPMPPSECTLAYTSLLVATQLIEELSVVPVASSPMEHRSQLIGATRYYILTGLSMIRGRPPRAAALSPRSRCRLVFPADLSSVELYKLLDCT